MTGRTWAAALVVALGACGVEGRRTVSGVSQPGTVEEPDGMVGGGAPGSGAGGAGAPGAGGADPGAGEGAPAGRPFHLAVIHEDRARRILAVTPDGVAYATASDGAGTILASRDGRSWEPRSRRADGASYTVGTALGSGTLLVDAVTGSGNVISRSDDGGRTWSDVLSLGAYRILTPHNVAELGGEVLLLEYQSFTGENVPLHLWASQDDGRTWAVRSVYTDHRHGHGLLADAEARALWLFFGDRTGGTYLSFDQGLTAEKLRSCLDGGCLVDAVTTPTGLLAGMDSLYQPLAPHVVTLDLGGAYDQVAALPGPSYSLHRLNGGGYVIGAAREAGGDVYGAGPAAAHLLTSDDGAALVDALQFPSLGGPDAARADVYWELPSGELLLELRNVEGFPRGGYALLAVDRAPPQP